MRQSRKSRWVSAVAIAMIVVAAGCTSSGDDAGGATGRIGKRVQLANGVVLVLDEGSVTAGSTIRQELVEVVPPSGASHTGAPPIELAVDGGELVGTVSLEFPYDPVLVPDGMSPADVFAVVTAETADAAWSAPAFTVDAERHVLVVETAHFSIWDDVLFNVSAAAGWLQQGVGQALGNRAPPPVCGGGGRGPLPGWVNSVVVADFSNAPVRACAEGEGDVAVIEMVNNRKYPMVLTYGAPVKWGWHDTPKSLGDNLVSEAIAGSLPPNSLFLPPLSRASIGVARGDWFYAGFDAAPTRLTVGAAFLSIVIDRIGAEVTGAIARDMAGNCLNSYVIANMHDPVPGDRGQVGQIIRNVAGCLADMIVRNGIPALTDSRGSVGDLDAAWRYLRMASVAGWGAELGGALTPLVDYFLGDPLPVTMSINRRSDAAAAPTTTAPSPAASPSTPPTTSPPMMSAPTASPTTHAPPATGASSYRAQQASRGANTFADPTNASGPGPRIEPNQWVDVSCKVKPLTTIDSAYPDGYWYRIASPPWNNAYYAVANTFWNGDTPATPRDQWHNTDHSIPDC